MLLTAVLCGLSIIALGLTTGDPEIPPMQALTFGGMFLIAAAFGKLWRIHGIGAATVVALMTCAGLAFSVWRALTTFVAAEPVPPPLLGQLAAFLIALVYFIVGLAYLLRLMKARRTQQA